MHYPVTLACLFAVPMDVLFTFVANFSDVSVSFRCACMGETMTNMRHFELPPREYWRRYVSYRAAMLAPCSTRICKEWEGEFTLEFL